MRRSIALTLVPLAIVACSDSRDTAGDDGGKAGMVIAGPEAVGGIMLAKIQGMIDTSRGCVTLAELEGGIVFPFGTTWDDDSQVVVLADGRELADGDFVSGGGGYVQLATASLRSAAVECGWSATADTAWLQVVD